MSSPGRDKHISLHNKTRWKYAALKMLQPLVFQTEITFTFNVGTVHDPQALRYDNWTYKRRLGEKKKKKTNPRCFIKLWWEPTFSTTSGAASADASTSRARLWPWEDVRCLINHIPKLHPWISQAHISILHFLANDRSFKPSVYPSCCVPNKQTNKQDLWLKT